MTKATKKGRVSLSLQSQRNMDPGWQKSMATSDMPSLRSRRVNDDIFKCKQGAERENKKQGATMNSQSPPVVQYFLQHAALPPQTTLQTEYQVSKYMSSWGMLLI